MEMTKQKGADKQSFVDRMMGELRLRIQSLQDAALRAGTATRALREAIAKLGALSQQHVQQAGDRLLWLILHSHRVLQVEMEARLIQGVDQHTPVHPVGQLHKVRPLP